MQKNGTQINHTIFEKKHHYMSIMKEIEILRRQMEYETLEKLIPEDRLTEATEIRNRIFIELIREGLVHQYIKSAENTEKDIIRLTIDGIDYDCSAIAIYGLLKDGFRELIPEGSCCLSGSEVNVDLSSKLEESAEKNERALKSKDSDLVKNQSDKEQSDMDAVPAVPQETSQADTNQIADDINRELEEQPIPDECSKARDSFIYDYCKVSAIMEGGGRGEEFEFVIAPLKLCRNNSKADIVVWCKKENSMVCVVTDEKNIVRVDIEGHSFLVRGSFHNGAFASYIYAAGLTLNAGYNLKIDTVKHRCIQNEGFGRGHICYAKGTDIIHVFPISEENEGNGTALCIVVTEKDGRRQAGMFPDTAQKDKTLCEGKYHIYNYWDGDILISELLNADQSEPEHVKEQKKSFRMNRAFDMANIFAKALIKAVVAVLLILLLFWGVGAVCNDKEIKRVLSDKISVFLQKESGADQERSYLDEIPKMGEILGTESKEAEAGDTENGE